MKSFEYGSALYLVVGVKFLSFLDVLAISEVLLSMTLGVLECVCLEEEEVEKELSPTLCRTSEQRAEDRRVPVNDTKL